jgi:hypothetical protein
MVGTSTTGTYFGNTRVYNQDQDYPDSDHNNSVANIRKGGATVTKNMDEVLFECTDHLNDHDHDIDDAKLVDNVLSKELMKLSVQDRNDIQEEIHGVRCMAPTETPELLKQSLEQLQWEIDNTVPLYQKHAYLQSQKQSANANSANIVNSIPSTYVNTAEFRLRFLRCELFDVRKAAHRMTKFLNLVLELWGNFALQRPIQITDFSKQELKQLRKGKYQFLPYRDRCGVTGRRIVCVFPDVEWEAIPPVIRNKIMMYYIWVAGNDTEVQKEGLVFLAWFDKSFKVSHRPPIQTKDHEWMTVRAVAVHLCSPDTAFYRLRRSVMTMRIGRRNRTRLVVHLGEAVELLYELQTYGIPSNQIPISYTGNIKTVHLKQWMTVRALMEDSRCYNIECDNRGSGASSDSNSATSSDTSHCKTNNNKAASKIIESPYLSDIIFRKGFSMISHQGNVVLRTLIVAKAREELQSQRAIIQPPKPNNNKATKQNKKTNYNKKIGRFVSEIIREVRETTLASEAEGLGKACRFLVWDEAGWWTECVRDKEFHARIEYIARGIRNTVIKNHKMCVVFNSGVAKQVTTTPIPTPIDISTTLIAMSNTMATPPTTKSTPTPIKAIAMDPSKTLRGDAPVRRGSSDSTTESTTTTTVSTDNKTTTTYNETMTTTTTTTQEDHRIQHQNQQGGTSIFRFQDHSDPKDSLFLCLSTLKKKRLVSMGDNNFDDGPTKRTTPSSYS